jgi:hypothetical protein
VCVAFGVLASALILRPPGRVQEEVDELERDFDRASASAQLAEQLA